LSKTKVSRPQTEEKKKKKIIMRTSKRPLPRPFTQKTRIRVSARRESYSLSSCIARCLSYSRS
jgi:hypothetical protein